MNEEEKKEQEISIQQYESEKAEAIDVINKFASEDHDESEAEAVTLSSVLGGDILQSKFLKQQVVFVMFIVLLAIIYTGNRYSSQRDAITIDSLQMRLQTEKYNVLTLSSELLNESRRSRIETMLQEQGDTALINQSTPPYLIKKEN